MHGETLPDVIDTTQPSRSVAIRAFLIPPYVPEHQHVISSLSTSSQCQSKCPAVVSGRKGPLQSHRKGSPHTKKEDPSEPVRAVDDLATLTSVRGCGSRMIGKRLMVQMKWTRKTSTVSWAPCLGSADRAVPSDDQDIVAVVSTTMTEDACRSEEPPVSVNPPIDDQTSPIVEPSARNVNPSVQPPPPPPPPAPPPPPLADIAAQLQSFASALSKHAESDPQEVDKLKVAVQQVEEDLKTTRSESNAALHRLQMENETLKTENHVLKTKLNSNAKEAIAREEHWRAEENTWKAKYAQLRGDNDALFKEKKKVEEGSKFHLLAALDALGVSKPGWKTG